MSVFDNINARMWAVTSAVYMLAGSAVFGFAPQLASALGTSSRVVYILSGFTMLFGLGGFILGYLRGDFPAQYQSRSQYDIAEYNVDLSKMVSDLREQMKEEKAKLLPMGPQEKAALRTELKAELKEALASDAVSQIEQKYSDKIEKDARASNIRGNFENTLRRLSKEIEALSRRSNVNLVIGVLTTIVAVGLLTFLVLGSTTASFTGFPHVLSHFIPRISIAVFIEVFSFFFLRLYKSNLEEIKYFQNELTNVEMKIIAQEAALLPPTKSSETIIDRLTATDRNAGQLSTISTNRGIELKDIADLLEKIGKVVSPKQ